jgi:hypothetical protein
MLDSTGTGKPYPGRERSNFAKPNQYTVRVQSWSIDADKEFIGD